MDEVFEYSDELGEYTGYNDEEGVYATGTSAMVPMAADDEHDEMAMAAAAAAAADGAVEEVLERKPRAVHQCNECNKIFVSFKGLQQHAIIHTDQKPFPCDLCGKAFRFKSNLFEHRSVHSGTTPHICPFCGKTCRLKGNLKKHLKTHVHTKEELDEAWRPFASNRRPPSEIPHDAIIVRSTGEPSSLFVTPVRPRKRKLGLGADAQGWVEKIRRGEILPTDSIVEKMNKLMESLKQLVDGAIGVGELVEHAHAIPFERFDCPLCKAVFASRRDCFDHIDAEHPMLRFERPLFCETCLKSFVDRKSLEQHESYHKRVQLLVTHGEIIMHQPDMMLPEELCDDEDELL